MRTLLTAVAALAVFVLAPQAALAIVTFTQLDADDRIGCARSSAPDYIADQGEAARTGLCAAAAMTETAQSGAAGPAAVGPAGTGPGTCTIEQIAAMARANLTDERIRTACE